MTEIHIDWEGPFSADELTENQVDKSEDDPPENIYQLTDPKKDYGIYQIYGYHAVYGADTLLYIDAVTAQDGTFASKIPAERYEVSDYDYWTSDSVSVCVGRLTGPKESSGKNWSEEIIFAKKLLIFAHSPAYNYNQQELMLEFYKRDALFDIHVFNWGKHKRLLPEVSGRRYARVYPENKNFHPYGKR